MREYFRNIRDSKQHLCSENNTLRYSKIEQVIILHNHAILGGSLALGPHGAFQWRHLVRPWDLEVYILQNLFLHLLPSGPIWQPFAKDQHFQVFLRRKKIFGNLPVKVLKVLASAI